MIALCTTAFYFESEKLIAIYMAIYESYIN